MQEIGTSLVSPVSSTVPLVAPAGQQAQLAPAARRRFVALSLIAGDLATVTIVVGLLELVAGSEGSGSIGLWLVWSTVALAALALAGLHGSGISEPVDRLRRRLLANLAAAVLLVSLTGAGGLASGLGPFAIAFGTLLAIPLGYYIDALVRGFLIRRGVWAAATALYGSMAACAVLARNLAERPDLGLRPVAILADEWDRIAAPTQLAGLPVITPEQANIAAQQIEVALCASGEMPAEEPTWLSRLPLRRIYTVHDAHVHRSLHLRTLSIGDAFGLELKSPIHMSHNLRLKRAVDLLVALPACLLALPVIAVLALMVKLTDGGPAFYAQPRIGRNGRIFKVYKLRSMFVDAEARLAAHLAESPQAKLEWERFFKLREDPRILPVVGSFIRKTSADELPQLWNVLRGEMSVVGPRPFPEYHSERFDKRFQALRTSVPPGLTGLWQVTDRSDGDLAVQKRQDSFYIHNWSFWLDLYVLLQTVPVVLAARGAR